jgi:hypothetical protein
MTMRMNKITTYLRAEDAHTIIEFLDQLREMLIASYGDEIAALLQEASHGAPDSPEEWRDGQREIV